MSMDEIGCDKNLVGELDVLHTHVIAILKKNSELQDENQSLQCQLQQIQAENIALRHKLSLVASRVEYIIANIPTNVSDERLIYDVTE